MVEVTTILTPDEFEFSRELQQLLNEGWTLLHCGSGTGANPITDTPRLELVAILQRTQGNDDKEFNSRNLVAEYEVDDSIEATEPGYVGDGFTEEFETDRDEYGNTYPLHNYPPF